MSTVTRHLILVSCCAASWIATGPLSLAERIEFLPATEPLKLPQGWSLGSCSAVAINSRDEVYVFHRGERPILCFDRDGNYLRSWGDDLIRTAHGLRVDRDDHVWATDIGGHRVYQFDSTGKVLLALGTGKPGDAADQFNQPTDIAFGPRGEFFVADGYGNSRVLKFSPSGGFIQAWGTRGKRPGEFHLPHSILVDARGRLLVGDRENNRIQIFDLEGKPLGSMNGPAPYGLAQDSVGNLFVADGRAHEVLALDEAGKLRQSWGGLGTAPGKFQMPHMLACDSAGNLYVAEVNGKRLQKFIRQQPAK